jgi:hypothetical protein
MTRKYMPITRNIIVPGERENFFLNSAISKPAEFQEGEVNVLKAGLWMEYYGTLPMSMLWPVTHVLWLWKKQC